MTGAAGATTTGSGMGVTGTTGATAAGVGTGTGTAITGGGGGGRMGMGMIGGMMGTMGTSGTTGATTTGGGATMVVEWWLMTVLPLLRRGGGWVVREATNRRQGIGVSREGQAAALADHQQGVRHSVHAEPLTSITKLAGFCSTGGTDGPLLLLQPTRASRPFWCNCYTQHTV